MGQVRLIIVLAAGIFALAANSTPSFAIDAPGPLPTNPYGASVEISILDIGDSGATADGTLFFAEPNPTSPSSGTGVFEPFKRIQRSTGECSPQKDCASVDGGALDLTGTDFKIQNGFNTDAGEPGINFDTKNGSMWTRSVTMGELDTSTGYIELLLDANQLGSATDLENRIVITDMQIFIGAGLDNPESIGGGVEGTGYTGAIYDPTNNSLLGNTAAWELDNGTNGNIDVVLQASICDCMGQGGSGKGDLSVFIPVSLLGTFSPTDNFVLYTEYMYVNDGFEEWSFRSAEAPEPGALILFVFGLAGLEFFRRRRFNGAVAKS